MARVALVNPQLISSGWLRGLQPQTMDDALPRHSLTILSAALKRAGHEVCLIDTRLLSGWEEYDAQLQAYGPEFVGVTAHTSECDAALECCARAKRVVPAATVIAGGIHFTMFPEVALRAGTVDHVVRGEGEVSLPALIRNPEGAAQVLWGEAPDLDAVPFEDRDLYSDYADRIRFPMWDLPTPIVDVLTKRGCPWQCRFCCGPGEQNLYTKPSGDPDHRFPTFRHRSVPNVIAELEELYQRFQFRGVVFHDDQFIIRREWVVDFCRALHASGFVARGIRWWAAVRADVICRYPELIAMMRDAGQQVMSIGFESFSDRMLKWMRKDTTRALNMRAAEICQRYGLELFANVIFGMPYADGQWYLEDDIASITAIEEIRPRHFSPSYFSPIPGSWFYQWAVEQDLLEHDGTEHSGQRTPNESKMKGVDYAQIEALLADYERRHGAPVLLKRPLRMRVKQFLQQPARTQAARLRTKLLG